MEGVGDVECRHLWPCSTYADNKGTFEIVLHVAHGRRHWDHTDLLVRVVKGVTRRELVVDISMEGVQVGRNPG